MDKIKSLLLSGVEGDFLIGIILLSKYENYEIIEIMSTLGGNLLLGSETNYCAIVDNLPLSYKYIECNSKKFFVGQNQFQFIKEFKWGHPEINLD